ncbi:MAG: hypothetical protein NTX50_28010 [Candidatus Sumerlaeota bacterium]|nr:hypothetical protein [Candidatus Sumerlaeota bacterium]
MRFFSTIAGCACLLILINGSLLPAAQFPFHDVAVSDCVDLSGEWLFTFDPQNAGARESWFGKDYDRSKWKPVAVPGVWDQKPGAIGQSYGGGIGWFCRRIAIPKEWLGDISITFLGSMFTTDVWVNGEYAGLHRGGYTPFTFALTNLTTPGCEVSLVTRVDARLNDRTIPASHSGWLKYSGLYREVYLAHHPRVRLRSTFVNTTVDEAQNALLTLTSEFYNGSNARCQTPVVATLYEGNRKVAEETFKVMAVAKAKAPLTFKLFIAKPRLWFPDSPFLHRMRIEWRHAGTQQAIEFPVGLREIRIEGSRFLVNNRRLWLQGFGQHEEDGAYGPCYSPERRRQQLERMKKDYQCNTLRPGHYPNHPALYDLCDELGFLVFSEIPVWQIPPYYGESSEAWSYWEEPQLSEMICSLRNHPSVASWSPSNETVLPRYFTRAMQYIKKLDPTRPVAPVLASTEWLELYRPEYSDYGARNFHYGWYHSNRVYSVREGLQENAEGSQGRPIWVAELGALATYGELYGSYGDQSRGSEIYQDHVIRFNSQYCSTASNQIMGVSVWTWTDFESGGIPHGILTLSGEPKLAASSLCNIYRGDRRLLVCENDAAQRTGGTWAATLYYFNPLAESSGAPPQVMKGMNAKWKILRGMDVVTSGGFVFDAGTSRSQEIGEVKWAIPANAPAGLFTFWIELTDAQGRWLYTNSSPFEVNGQSQTGVLSAQALRDGKPIAGAYLLMAGIRIPIYAFPGLQIPLPEGRYPLTFCLEGSKDITKEIQIKSGKRESVNLEFVR